MNEQPNSEIKEVRIEDIKIPECCREGWKTCKHVVKKEKPKRVNKGL